MATIREVHKVFAIVMSDAKKKVRRFAPDVERASAVPALFKTIWEAEADCRDGEEAVPVTVTIEEVDNPKRRTKGAS